MKLTKANAREFGWEGLKGWAFNEKSGFPNATAAYVESTSSHGKIKNTGSDIVYYVVDGEGEFCLGKLWFSVKKGEVVIIPKNTPYDFRTGSKLKLFLVHIPGYEPSDDVKL